MEMDIKNTRAGVRACPPVSACCVRACARLCVCVCVCVCVCACAVCRLPTPINLLVKKQKGGRVPLQTNK